MARSLRVLEPPEFIQELSASVQRSGGRVRRNIHTMPRCIKNAKRLAKGRYAFRQAADRTESLEHGPDCGRTIGNAVPLRQLAQHTLNIDPHLDERHEGVLAGKLAPGLSAQQN